MTRELFYRAARVAGVIAGSLLGVGGLYMWMSILGAFNALGISPL